MCGSQRAQAMAYLQRLEALTAPQSLCARAPNELSTGVRRTGGTDA